MQTHRPGQAYSGMREVVECGCCRRCLHNAVAEVDDAGVVLFLFGVHSYTSLSAKQKWVRMEIDVACCAIASLHVVLPFVCSW